MRIFVLKISETRWQFQRVFMRWACAPTHRAEMLLDVEQHMGFVLGSVCVQAIRSVAQDAQDSGHVLQRQLVRVPQGQ